MLILHSLFPHNVEEQRGSASAAACGSEGKRRSLGNKARQWMWVTRPQLVSFLHNAGLVQNWTPKQVVQHLRTQNTCLMRNLYILYNHNIYIYIHACIIVILRLEIQSCQKAAIYPFLTYCFPHLSPGWQRSRYQYPVTFSPTLASWGKTPGEIPVWLSPFRISKGGIRAFDESAKKTSENLLC